MGTRKTIDVGLSPAEALAIVEKSFGAHGGWTTARDEQQLLAYPSELRNIPETLAVRIEVATLPANGTRVTAEIVRYRLLEYVGEHLGSLAANFLLAPFVTLVFMPIAYGTVGFTLLKKLRDAKHRMIRLAIEPLQPHEVGRDGGPFRH